MTVGVRGAGPGDSIPKGYRGGQLNQFTPEQMGLFQQLFSHVGPESYLSRLSGGDQSAFAETEAPAQRQFQQQLGGIASRFSGMGTGGRHSSGFQNTTTAAASNFAQDLASRRHDMRRQAIQDLMGISSDLLGQRQYDKFLVEKQQKQNPWAQIGSAFAGAIPGALASFANPLSGFGGGGSSVYNQGQYNAAPGLEDAFRTGNYAALGGY